MYSDKEAGIAADKQRDGVLDHKWLDPVCNAGGCRSLILEHALKKLAFLAMTSGGTAGPDAELQGAIKEATDLLVHTREAS